MLSLSTLLCAIIKHLNAIHQTSCLILHFFAYISSTPAIMSSENPYKKHYITGPSRPSRGNLYAEALQNPAQEGSVGNQRTSTPTRARARTRTGRSLTALSGIEAFTSNIDVLALSVADPLGAQSFDTQVALPDTAPDTAPLVSPTIAPLLASKRNKRVSHANKPQRVKNVQVYRPYGVFLWKLERFLF
jgi:hypothetical protein